MKFKKILPILLVSAAIILVAACKKSRYCHCVSDNYTIVINSDTVVRADTAVVNVDRAMKCEGIKIMNFRTKDEGPVVYTDREVKCIELDVDTVKVLP
ncbi:MAG: hypothetical protein IKS36_02030 [Bacteroidales bacterium]|nr:hypothetical protein [Bacteroidales bacterium]MCR5066001.1 hypothetical protein [Bacteroidales bacterium]